MPREVRELVVRQALNRVTGMGFRWSLNPYRGCQHACAYCYARATHRYFDLSPGDDFSRVLFVKRNLPEVLAAEVRRRTWRRERVALGTATDPYQPLEGHWHLTRRCLEVLADSGTPVSVVTKGTLILRDVDLLSDMARRGLVQVMVSIPTVDEDVWRRSEPGTPAPRHRLKAAQALRAAGVPVGVLMAPLLPNLTDDAEHLRTTLAAIKEAGAAFAGAQLVRLVPEVKAVYFRFLDTFYPDLRPLYEQWYQASPNAPTVLRQRLARRLAAACLAAGVAEEWPDAESREAAQIAFAF